MGLLLSSTHSPLNINFVFIFYRGPEDYQFFHNCHVFTLLPYLTLPYLTTEMSGSLGPN